MKVVLLNLLLYLYLSWRQLFVSKFLEFLLSNGALVEQIRSLSLCSKEAAK